MRRAALLALIACLLAPAVMSAAASPPPTSVCPVCGYELESVAESHGVDLTVAGSEATARLHENGTATWTARVRAVDPDSFRALNASVGLRTAAEEAFGYGGPPAEVRDVGLDGDTLVVRYARSGQLGRSWGVFRYAGLRDDPGYAYVDLGADRVTVVGPPGTAVARAPAGATVEDGRVTLTSLPGPEGPFLAFAPEGTALPGGRAALAVFLPLLPVFARNAFWFVGLPCLLLGGGLSGLRYGLRDRSLDRRLVARGVGALAAGLLAVVGLDVALGPSTRVPLSPGPNPAVVAGAVATLLLAVLVARGVSPRVREAVGSALGAAAVGVGVAVVVTLAVPGESVTVGVRGSTQVVLGVPVLLAFPLGVAARADARTWRVALGGVLLTAAGFLAFQFDVFRTSDYVFSLAVVLAVLAAVLGTLAAVPLFLLGWTAAPDAA